MLPFSLRDSVLSDIIEKTKQTRMELQSVMWEYVGIVRSTVGMATGRIWGRLIKNPPPHQHPAGFRAAEECIVEDC
jgi:aspartate oxidase